MKYWDLCVGGQSFEQERWTGVERNEHAASGAWLYLIFMTMPHEGVGIRIPSYSGSFPQIRFHEHIWGLG